MKETSISKELSFPGVVLSDRIPLFLASQLVNAPSPQQELFLSFFRSVYHASFLSMEGHPLSVFTQLQEDKIQDLFCQCDEKGCSHVAGMVRSIFARSHTPLHTRFYSSPYYRFFSLYKPSEKSIHVSEDKSELRVATDHHPIVVEGAIQSFLDMLESDEENEESSIKFAYLSEEELNAWYKGMAPSQLSFELSHLCDLARFLFVKETREGQPRWEMRAHRLIFIWKDMKVSLVLSEPVDYALFASLIGYPASHPIIPFSQVLSLRCSFDKALKVHIEGTVLNAKEPLWKKEKESVVRQWPCSYSLVVQNEDEQERWLDDLALASCPDLIPGIHPIEWTVNLSEKGLEVSSRVLGEKGQVFIGRWLLLQSGKFVETSGSFFQLGRVFIASQDLPEWIDQNRAFLSLFPGFRVQDHPFVKNISYELSSQGALSFVRKAKSSDESWWPYDDWVFVARQGFFSKEQQSISIPLHKPILPHRVAEFIREKRKELEPIPGFFAQESPIKNVLVRIGETQKKRIVIEPTIVWKEEWYEQELSLFDEFGYIPSIGFFEMPSDLKLTKEIRQIDREEWNHFFEKELPILSKREGIQIDARLKVPDTLQLMCNKLDPTVVDETAMDGNQFWNVDFFWRSSLGSASFQEVMLAKRRGERWLITDAGVLFLDQSRFEWLLLLTEKKKGKSSRPSIKTWDFFKIRAHDSLHFDLSMEIGGRSLVDKLLHDAPIDPLPPLDLLHCSLRPYQQTGLEWLWMLYSFGLSGLLCDDMGVGKTHQAMALLAAIKTSMDQRKRHRPFLVVCPTSLIWHWREKILTFLPSFKLFSYLGHDRTLEQFSPETHDLLLTTYGIWRNEIHELKNLSFEVAIFDELQIAKNHFSRIWAALSQVSAMMRIGLTGTPIENQLRELKALFDLLVPDYLPDEALFKQLYVRPWEKHQEEKERFESLSRYVRPFILRRKKSEVLRDLPEKVEERYHVELLDQQKELYRQVASQQVGMLIQQLRDEAVPIPYIHIFSLLSSLKQICNHPASYLKEMDQYEQYESGKWDAFLELIDEALDSGQKVVVFSQFLNMLDIMKLYFDKHNIGFAEIRGRTRERGKEMQRFQKDPQCKVFLGSLQAAGLGIDLTAATVVIHYDRWWNAARENQATDRVHRIGQKRGVQVCKLITIGTIEERIDRMIERKSQLLEDVIAYDDHQVVKKLSRSELLELIQDLASQAN